MPTAPSSTEAAPSAYDRPGRVAAARRAIQDVAILFHFRAQAVRRRHLSRGLVASFVLVTLAIAIVPAFLPGAQGAGKAFDIFLLMPSAMAGILALNVASAVASGGGRELLSRDQASPYPISPTTDHLGALAAGAAQHRLDDPGLDPARVDGLQLRPGQPLPGPGGRSCSGWSSRPRSGRWSRGRWSPYAAARTASGSAVALLVCLALVVGLVQLTGHTTDVLDPIPTLWIFQGGVSGWGYRWWVVLVALLVGSVAAVGRGRRTHTPRRAADAARRSADGDRPARAAGPAAHRPRAADPRRPGVRLALGADASRRAGPRHRPRPRGGLRQPAVVLDDDPAGPGRLRWRAALRGERLVSRRPRRPLAGEPARSRPRRCSTRGRGCSPSSSQRPP